MTAPPGGSSASRLSLYALVTLLVMCVFGTGAVLWFGLFLRPGVPEATPTDPAASTTDQVGPRLVLAEQAAGLMLVGGADGELAARQGAMEQAGFALRDMVSGRYGPSTDEEQVTFYGGTLVQPVPEPDLGARAASILDDVFRVNFPNLDSGGTPGRDYDAGELGGYVRCRSYPDVSYFACGWIDQFTIGYTFGRAESEEAAAALLVALRLDIEQAA